MEAKKLLVLIAIVMCITMVIFNFGFAVWIFWKLDINFEGLGPLKIVKGGVKVTGRIQAEKLVGNKIESRPGLPLTLETTSTLHLYTTNKKNKAEIFLSQEDVQISTNNFLIRKQDGRRLLSANEDGVVIGTKNLRLEGGGRFEEYIETRRVQSNTGENLHLESFSGKILMYGDDGILVNGFGGVNITGYEKIVINSTEGAVKINAMDIRLLNLPISYGKRMDSPDTVNENENATSVFLVCACSSGILFASPTFPCIADENVCKSG